MRVRINKTDEGKIKQKWKRKATREIEKLSTKEIDEMLNHNGKLKMEFGLDLSTSWDDEPETPKNETERLSQELTSLRKEIKEQGRRQEFAGSVETMCSLLEDEKKHHEEEDQEEDVQRWHTRWQYAVLVVVTLVAMAVVAFQLMG